MEIGFYLDNIYHHGTAVPYEIPGTAEKRFVVQLEDWQIPVFQVHKSDSGKWDSDEGQAADLISAVGAEIEKRDVANPRINIEAGRYTSSELMVNGEIVNEPEDVHETSFD